MWTISYTTIIYFCLNRFSRRCYYVCCHGDVMCVAMSLVSSVCYCLSIFVLYVHSIIHVIYYV